MIPKTDIGICSTGCVDEIVAKIEKNAYFSTFYEKNMRNLYIYWADIYYYSIKSPLASITAQIRPLNRVQALLTMSLSMVVKITVMEATFSLKCLMNLVYTWFICKDQLHLSIIPLKSLTSQNWAGWACKKIYPNRYSY